MALTEIRLAIANVPDGVTREALNQMASLLERYNTHTHISAAEDAATSYPSTASPAKSVPDGAVSTFSA